MATFVLAVSFSAYRSRALPRTLVWIGIILGALGLATPIMGFTDPVNYNPLPYLAALLWIAAIGVARMVGETKSRRTVIPDAATGMTGVAAR
jgi:hypothetical protein